MPQDINATSEESVHEASLNKYTRYSDFPSIIYTSSTHSTMCGRGSASQNKRHGFLTIRRLGVHFIYGFDYVVLFLGLF